MIKSLLVANRGEIARRVFRTCRDLGISTVAIHSDADADMPFVKEADIAIRLEGNSPAQTYLRGDLIIEAALAAGADAIHPGYGFLSENAEFASAVTAAGIIWVGPDPASIESMGSKISAKELMAAAGVPVLANLDSGEATEADLPLLVKASAGGGGRGMRIVRELANLPAEIEKASAEAASAFGDGTVFVEPYVEHGRHIEVQVLGTIDAVMVLGERDCSVQRRHQKVIEEAPAPGLSDATRSALHEAARNAAQAIDYRGAGTVEFLFDSDRDRFYFLEMNTRLQVEHPVTEAVFGVDLVAMQLAVAEGVGCDQLTANFGLVDGAIPNGHAVEVRLYAEDPAAGYQPQSGRLRRFDIPGVDAEFANLAQPGIRLDSGVGAGDEIGTFYDAMIAKVVAWSPTREQALRRLAGTLERSKIHGIRTNRDLLVSLLRDPTVVGAGMHTTWLDGLDPAVLIAPGESQRDELSAFAATIVLGEQARLSRHVQQRIPAGFRNVAGEPQATDFTLSTGDSIRVLWRGGNRFTLVNRPDVTVTGIDVPESTSGTMPSGPGVVTIRVGGLGYRFEVYIEGAEIDVESSLGHVALTKTPRFVDPATQLSEGSLLAPMPGSIVGVDVSVGDQVTEGQQLLVLEAMKMQHAINSPYAGTVVEVAAGVGQQVDAGTVLAVVHATDDSENT